MFLPMVSWAQLALSGKVLDERSGQALVGATVSLQTNQVSLTNQQGAFFFTNISAGTYVLKVSFVGYQALEKK